MPAAKQSKVPQSKAATLEQFKKLCAGEPTPPADGSCFVCGDPRRPERSQRYAKGCAELDAFCSADCARSYHGNPLPDRSIWAHASVSHA